ALCWYVRCSEKRKRQQYCYGSLDQTYLQSLEMLDASRGHIDDVVHLHGFLYDERFTVFYANEGAVKTSDGGQPLFYLLMRRKKVRCTFRIAVLGSVAQQSGHAALK